MIASAITDKEIPTSNTDSFQTMADNIRNIKVGINVTLDGKPLDYDFKLKSEGYTWIKDALSKIPYQFYNSSAVVYNNEIHILGTTFSTSLYNYHYKWDGTSWVSASIIPYYCYSGSAVVYNNKPYILGGGTDPSLTLKFSPVYSIN